MWQISFFNMILRFEWKDPNGINNKRKKSLSTNLGEFRIFHIYIYMYTVRSKTIMNGLDDNLVAFMCELSALPCISCVAKKSTIETLISSI